MAIQAWCLEELQRAYRDNQLASVLDFLAKVAYHCVHDSSNWHSVCGMPQFFEKSNLIGIFGAMNLTNIHINLQEGWNHVEPNAKKFYQEYKDVFTPTGRQQLTDIMKDISAPCVPVFGTLCFSIHCIYVSRPVQERSSYNT